MTFVLVLIFGIIFICYGIYMVVVRAAAPQKLGKHSVLQKIYGHKIGFLLHFIFYSLLPIISGIVMALLGIVMWI